MDKSVSLYGLSKEYSELYHGLLASVDEDGVADESLFAAVTQKEEEFAKKAVATATVWRMLGDDVAELEREKERLTKLIERLKTAQKRTETYLSNACETAGIESVKGVYANISFRNNPPSVKIDDESAIPDEYMTEKVTRTPNKAKIKAAIDRGAIITGVHLERTKTIQIK